MSIYGAVDSMFDMGRLCLGGDSADSAFIAISQFCEIFLPTIENFLLFVSQFYHSRMMLQVCKTFPLLVDTLIKIPYLISISQYIEVLDFLYFKPTFLLYTSNVARVFLLRLH